MTAIATVADPVTFEILSHRLNQISMEMGTTLERVGGTVNTTQMKDYIAALYRANGDILCTGQAMVWHVPCAGVAVKSIIERFEKEGGIYPGDMFLLNDPYVAAIHQSDVYLVSPIHYKERLVGWSATFVHVMDIGAMSPGGNSPGATEICHEGVRIAGIKLIERGTLRKDVFDAITNMTRQPVMVGLDLKCEIAANNVARARMQEMYEQYGPELLDAVADHMFRYTESVLRKRIAEIPDGCWSAAGAIQAQDTWNVRLSLAKKADRLRFDFSGSDAQASVGINLPYHATVGACFEAVLSTLGHDLPKNHGLLSVMDVVAPEGSVVNPRYPAPVSLNTTSGGAVARYLANSVLAQMAATSEKWQPEVMAQNLGSRLARHAGTSQYGRYYVSTLIGLSGGGARSYMDGMDSAGMETGRPSSCHNVEWVEVNFPLLHLFRRHITDGAGAGQFRGGAGEETALMLHDAPEREITFVAFGTAGLRNSGQGIGGGYPGAPSLLVHMEDTTLRKLLQEKRCLDDLQALGGKSTLLPYCTIRLTEDDVLFMRFGNGGGYGDPLDRDPQLVANDVANGLVSSSAAGAVYGVEVSPTGELDAKETERRRVELKKERLGGAISMMSGRPRADGRPLQANLHVVADGSKRRICCTRCGHLFCEANDDWTREATRRNLTPTDAGPLMSDLVGKFVLAQLSCPSCAVVLRTDVAVAN